MPVNQSLRETRSMEPLIVFHILPPSESRAVFHLDSIQRSTSSTVGKPLCLTIICELYRYQLLMISKVNSTSV